MIPKIIHYCWLSGDPLPKEFQKNLDDWKEQLSDYQFMLWDFNRFNPDDHPFGKWVKEAFSVKRYAWASDPIRLFALYTYGGIYMDLDVELKKPFGKLLESDYMLGYEYSGTIEAGIMGTAPNLQWTKVSLEDYYNRAFIQPDGTHEINPLPNKICAALARNHIQLKDRLTLDPDNNNDKDLYILPPVYLSAKKENAIMATQDTYTIHHFAASSAKLSYTIKKKIRKYLGMNVFNFLIWGKRIVYTMLAFLKSEK